MSFIALHQENGFCGYEMNVISIEQVASVGPAAIGAKKWFNQTSKACVRLNDGRQMNVKETVSAILGLLEEARMRRSQEPAYRTTSIDELKQKIAMAW